MKEMSLFEDAESSVNNLAISSSVNWSSNITDEWRPNHCPLCDYSMLYPEKNDKKPAIIFLDIDGVLIEQWRSSDLDDQIRSTLKQLFPHGHKISYYSQHQQNVAHARHFDKGALKNLGTVIENIQESGLRPLIVLSSAWRHSSLLQQLCKDIYSQHKFSKYLCGKTPIEFKAEAYLSVECKLGFEFNKGSQEKYNLELNNRANAIEFWLKDHRFDPTTANFIAIDDAHTEYLSRFGERFIKTESLFSESNAKTAIEMLCVSH